jgi:tetratricopeptide (TPR) repeat protein
MRTGAQSPAVKQAFNEYERIEQLQNSGQHQPALDASKALVAKQPKWAYGHYALGVSLFLLGQHEEARKALRKAIALKPDFPEFHAKLGEVLHRLSDTDGAIEALDAAIAMEPNDARHPTTKAWILRLSGRSDEAFAILDDLYTKGERDHRQVRTYAGLLGQRGDPERGIEVLLEMVELGHPEPKMIAAHWYVLAKLYDQSGQYDEAYTAGTRGAELNAKTYDPQARALFMQEQFAAWSSETMPGLARSRSKSEIPVFVVGMPRSGTTLVEQIIAAHPEAFGAGELMNIFTAAFELVTPTDDSTTIISLANGLKTATLDRTARRILRDMEKRVPTGTKPKRITDKLLLNFQYLGLIEQLFPQARVIICTRHPLDTFISSYLLDFEGHNAHAYTDRPEWFAHFYALHLRYIEHYKEVCSLPILDIRYEDIVEDQRGQTERLLSFLGLEFDEACMQFFEHDRAVITASTDQVRKKLYRSALARHLHYRSHLGPVQDALAEHGVPLD